jgi:hypothetical protein
MKRFTILMSLVMALNVSYAHHGSSGQFDQSIDMEVSGVVKKIRFVNPHSYVYFDVTNEDGTVDEWRCEMRAATLLKRSGWTEEMFAPGTQIDIVGNPARREPFGCYVETIAINEGEAVDRYAQLDEASDVGADRNARTSYDKPNLAGDWAAPQRRLTQSQVRAGPGAPGGPTTGPAGEPIGAAPPPGDRPPGGPPGRRGGGSRYTQSEAGKEASAGYEREDNPRFHCTAVNIFMDWTFDQHINRIEQSESVITLTYGFMDIVRTIHMDMDAHPEILELSRGGHSIGSWDGDTLVVDTVAFEEGFLDTRAGVKHSDQLHVVERFTMDPADNSLSREYTGEDPLYLAAPFNGQDKIFLSEFPFDPYDCEDLTEEIVDGF